MKRTRQLITRTDEKEQDRTARRARKVKVGARETAGSGGDFPVKVRKKRPRGRPWPKGVSGNPAGRPKGARNKFTEAVLEGIRRAEEKLAQPRTLNPDKPYECWDGYLIQEGLWFGWDPLIKDYVALPDQDPPPTPPTRFDPSARRTEMTWKGRLIYVQHGWPFDPGTWKRIKGDAGLRVL